MDVDEPTYLKASNFPIDLVAVIVDHGLQENSGEIAQFAKQQLGKLGFQDVTSTYLSDNYNISGRNIPNILVGDINQNGLIDIVNPDKGTSYGSPNNKNPSIIWEMGTDQKFIKK